MAQQFRNTDVHARTWGHLVDLETGHTLELEPGETTKGGVGIWTSQTQEVEGENGPETVDDLDAPAVVREIPRGFEDAYLKPVRSGRKGKDTDDTPDDDPAATTGATTDPADGKPAADPKE